MPLLAAGGSGIQHGSGCDSRRAPAQLWIMHNAQCRGYMHRINMIVVYPCGRVVLQCTFRCILQNCACIHACVCAHARNIPVSFKSCVHTYTYACEIFVAFLVVLCPLHISRSDAPIVPRCCRLGQCEWSPDTESAVGASSGGHRAILNMFNIA